MLAFVNANPTLFLLLVTLAWPMVTGAITLAFQHLENEKEHPTLAPLLFGAGLNGPAVVRLLRVVFALVFKRPPPDDPDEPQTKGPGKSALDKLSSFGAVLVLTASLLGATTIVACSWLRSAAPEVVDAGELVLHAADAGCGVVALLHDGGAESVCLAVHELDTLDKRLEEAETAERDTPLRIVAPSGEQVRIKVRHRHAKHARAAVKVARTDVGP